MNLRSGRNTGRGNSLLLGYYNRFQDGEFAKHGDLHGGAGVDGPVIARYSLGHLSVNRGRDFPHPINAHVESAQGCLLRCLLTTDAPRLRADVDRRRPLLRRRRDLASNSGQGSSASAGFAPSTRMASPQSVRPISMYLIALLPPT
jgi:hypothetical protein